MPMTNRSAAGIVLRVRGTGHGRLRNAASSVRSSSPGRAPPAVATGVVTGAVVTRVEFERPRRVGRSAEDVPDLCRLRQRVQVCRARGRVCRAGGFARSATSGVASLLIRPPRRPRAVADRLRPPPALRERAGDVECLPRARIAGAGVLEDHQCGLRTRDREGGDFPDLVQFQLDRRRGAVGAGVLVPGIARHDVDCARDRTRVGRRRRRAERRVARPSSSAMRSRSRQCANKLSTGDFHMGTRGGAGIVSRPRGTAPGVGAARRAVRADPRRFPRRGAGTRRSRRRRGRTTPWTARRPWCRAGCRTS